MVDKRDRRTKADMQTLRDVLLEEAQSGEHAHTVRHLFYRLVSRGAIPKSERAYKDVVIRLCGEMREDGTMPWSWIADHTRWQRRPDSYTSIEAALEHCRLSYRRDAMAECPDYVELWCEKNTLTGILSEITDKYDVPLMVSVGFSSKGFLHDTARTICAKYKAGKSSYIYQIGDHDPSGLVAWNAAQESIRRYVTDITAYALAGAAISEGRVVDGKLSADDQKLLVTNILAITNSVHFERLALTEEQIEEYDLPTRPTKRENNMHAKNFVGDSTEVDAMDTDTLLALVENKIQEHIPLATLNALRVIEESEREALAMFKPKGPEPKDIDHGR